MTAPSDVDGWLREARVRVFTDGHGTIVRLRGFSPVMAFFATMAIAIVLCGFAYPLTAMVFNPQPIPASLMFGACGTRGAIQAMVAVLALDTIAVVRSPYEYDYFLLACSLFVSIKCHDVFC